MPLAADAREADLRRPLVTTGPLGAVARFRLAVLVIAFAYLAWSVVGALAVRQSGTR